MVFSYPYIPAIDKVEELDEVNGWLPLSDAHGIALLLLSANLRKNIMKKENSNKYFQRKNRRKILFFQDLYVEASRKPKKVPF